jgi:S-methylmethionine-dependent homocysteine/selenocysteine methylase
MTGDVRNAAAAAGTPEAWEPREAPYRRIAGLIESGRCVILDGGTATELREVADDRPELQERLWGTGALVRSPAEVLRVHRAYVDVGCDVISTDTWGLPTAVRD